MAASVASSRSGALPAPAGPCGPAGPGGPTIALNAHGDVVPPGEGWTHDPYGGEVVDGKLYGRASAVSKCDFTTFIYATRALEAAAAAAGKPLRGAIELHGLGATGLTDRRSDTFDGLGGFWQAG